jgi:hypothetical protein
MAVTEFFPEPGVTVDGRVNRTGVDESFATLRAGAGTSATDNAAELNSFVIIASTTNSQYAWQSRGVFLFDTSSLGSDIVSAADFDLFYDTAQFLNALSGEASANSATELVETSPTSDTGLVAGDYNQHVIQHPTSFGKGGTQASITDGYNDTITVNANGLANIDGGGISKFGTVSGWDFNNTTTGLTWSSGSAQYTICSNAETTGTSEDPRLTVTHTAAAAGPPIGSLSMMGVGR